MYIRKSSIKDAEHDWLKGTAGIGTNRVLVACDESDAIIGFIATTMKQGGLVIDCVCSPPKEPLKVASALLKEVVGSNGTHTPIHMAAIHSNALEPILASLNFYKDATKNCFSRSRNPFVCHFNRFAVAMEEISDELKKGIEIEKEHASTYEWIKKTYEDTKKWPSIDEVAERIAKEHLEGEGMPTYYSDLIIPGEKRLKGKTSALRHNLSNLLEYLEGKNYIERQNLQNDLERSLRSDIEHTDEFDDTRAEFNALSKSLGYDYPEDMLQDLKYLMGDTITTADPELDRIVHHSSKPVVSSKALGYVHMMTGKTAKAKNDALPPILKEFLDYDLEVFSDEDEENNTMIYALSTIDDLSVGIEGVSITPDFPSMEKLAEFVEAHKDELHELLGEDGEGWDRRGNAWNISALDAFRKKYSKEGEEKTANGTDLTYDL